MSDHKHSPEPNDPPDWTELLVLLRASQDGLRVTNESFAQADAAVWGVGLKLVELQASMEAMMAALAMQPTINAKRLGRDFARLAAERVPLALAALERSRTIARAAQRDDSTKG